MTKLFKKYVWTVLLTALLFWILLTPSHFQKGGVDNYLYIALFVATVSILITLRFDKYHWIERFLVSFPFAFISLFLTSFIIVPIIVEIFYGDKTWILWQTKHRLFINFVFYGLNAAILTLLSIVYFNLRGKLNMEGKELKQ